MCRTRPRGHPPSRSSSPRGDRHRPQSQRDLRELMATIGHSSYVAALRYQHATAERNKAIADYLDDVIDAARRAPKSAPVRRRTNRAVPSVCHGATTSKRQQRRTPPPTCAFTKRRRAESNRRTGLCRPLPKPLGHAAVRPTPAGTKRAASLMDRPPSTRNGRAGSASRPSDLVLQAGDRPEDPRHHRDDGNDLHEEPDDADDAGEDPESDRTPTTATAVMATAWVKLIGVLPSRLVTSLLTDPMLRSRHAGRDVTP